MGNTKPTSSRISILRDYQVKASAGDVDVDVKRWQLSEILEFAGRNTGPTLKR